MDIKVSIPLFIWPLIFAFLFLIGMNGCIESGSAIQVEKLEEREIPFQVIRGGENYIISRVNRPYFDENNQLHWNDDRLDLEGCKISYPCWHKVLLLNPRVDYCNCQDQESSLKKLIGLNDQKKMVWQRKLNKFKNSSQFERVGGATPQAIVLNTLEVINPKNGTIIEPAIMEPFIGRFPNQTKPKYNFYTTSNNTIFRPKAKDFVFFEAEYLFFSTQGGLYLFNPKLEVKKLLKKGKRYFLKYIEVEDIALSEDERFAFLAQIWHSRGPDDIEFVIFDLENKQTVFKEGIENDCMSCTDPIIIIGKQGHVAMSYRLAFQKYKIVHYAITLPTIH